MNFRHLWLALIFCTVELVVSGVLYSAFFAVEKLINGSVLDALNLVLRWPFQTIIYRVALLQIVVEVAVVFLVIRFGGWENAWAIVLGVLVSVVIWAAGWAIVDGGSLEALKLGSTWGGVPILLGTWCAWLILYRWLGLKT